ncbi:hypothetical protein ES702_00657 [subsurface metagenome]
MTIRNRILPIPRISSKGWPDEEPFSPEEFSTLSEIFDGNADRIIERFTYLSTVAATALGHPNLVKIMRYLDAVIAKYFPTVTKHSFSSLIYLRKEEK